MKRFVRKAGKWVVAVAAVGAIALLVWIWFVFDSQRQDKWIHTAAVMLGVFAVFLIWVVFGSGWKPRLRWSVLLLTVAAILFARLALRISGVTGDLVPIVEWRWKRSALPEANVILPTNAESTVLSGQAVYGSYPQFLGPDRNGVVKGPKLRRDWHQSPPRELWRKTVGAAWSAFAVSGKFAVTQEQHGEEELVTCYDALTGLRLWAHRDPARYATTIAGEGPRATPTIESNRVWAIGGTGKLNCLDLETGQRLWVRDTIAEHQAKVPDWGVACSPLIAGDKVIVTVGGNGRALVAYDKHTGTNLWAAGNDDAHWSSPVAATVHAVPQILIFNDSVAAHDERSGKVLWQYPWRGGHPHVTMPLLLESNRVLISSGYGTGSELLQIERQGERWKARQAWKSIRMKSKFGNLIHIDGFIYGLDDGALACIDARTGGLRWKGDRYGHGQMIRVADLLLLMAESGEVVLIEPKPEEQREIARFKVFSDKTWNPPALAGDLLLVRNDREAACLRLPTLDEHGIVSPSVDSAGASETYEPAAR